MPDRNPFGDDAAPPPRRPSPFGEEPATESAAQAAGRIEQAARRIRSLRSQLGAEGLSPTAMRELIDEISTALESAARALRGVESR